MRLKSIFLILIVPIFGFSGLNMESINKALSSIMINKKVAKYYSKDSAFITKLSVNKTTNPNLADIIIFPETNIENGITIVDSKEKLKKNTNSIGAIFLKKGRTQIIFVKERMEKKNIQMSINSNRNFIIEECFLKDICLLKHFN